MNNNIYKDITLFNDKYIIDNIKPIDFSSDYQPLSRYTKLFRDPRGGEEEYTRHKIIMSQYIINEKKILAPYTSSRIILKLVSFPGFLLVPWIG